MKPDARKHQSQSDILDPTRAAALQVALGLTTDIVRGAVLPPYFHQIYFWSPAPPDSLGRDGHPRVGTGLIPDTGLPRRMWAGGRLAFHQPLIAGIKAQKTSEVEQIDRKQGRSGPLVFVTMRHDITQNGVLCLSEWQDVVYRADPEPDAVPAQPPPARQDETDHQVVRFSSTLLFRYSALTFNGHRIHYDGDYARDTEGYDGLVVHGPLLAQLLMLMADDLLGTLAAFRFRSYSALILPETATLCRKESDLWVRGPDGRLVMAAVASLA